MTIPEPYHSAYVLWLIRQGIANSWNELCAHFSIPSAVGLTQHGMLRESLRSLANARLIECEPGYFDSFTSLQARGDVRISAADLLADIQTALHFSLKDLAFSDPHQRLVVNPVLSQTFSSRYRSDVFVLMPFAEELKPIYEEHIKCVTERLGLSVARSDDFFTSEHIMDELWTAMVNAKLVIADCTDRNPNVFYEIGLGHAIGKPTILITQQDSDVPFDLRHRRYIPYTYTPHGMKEFEERLASTIKAALES